MGKIEVGKNIAISAEESKPPESISLILTHCCAFLAITLIVVGELMHEQNMWAVLVIGGSLCSMNVLLTSIRIEHRSQQFNKDVLELSPRSKNTREAPHRSQLYVGDSISIDMDSLAEETNDLSHPFYHGEDEKEWTISKSQKRRKLKSKHLRDRVDKPRRRDGRSYKRLKEGDIVSRRSERKRQKEKLQRGRKHEIVPEIPDRAERTSRKKKKRSAKKVRLAHEHTVVEV
ncbi:unnamed protein product [Agarophyton chilense]